MIWLLSLSWYNWWLCIIGYKSGWESSQLDKQKSPVAQLSTRIASSTVGAHHCWTFLGHLGLRENLEKMSNYEWWKIRINSLAMFSIQNLEHFLKVQPLVVTCCHLNVLTGSWQLLTVVPEKMEEGPEGRLGLAMALGFLVRVWTPKKFRCFYETEVTNMLKDENLYSVRAFFFNIGIGVERWKLPLVLWAMNHDQWWLIYILTINNMAIFHGHVRLPKAKCVDSYVQTCGALKHDILKLTVWQEREGF